RERVAATPPPLETRAAGPGFHVCVHFLSVPTKDQITEKLTQVIDPELRRSIVELGMVRSIEVRDDGRVEVVVSLTTPGCPIRSHFQQAVVKNVSELEVVNRVVVGFDVLSEG